MTPSVPLKTSLGAQNMKIGTDALGTVENESGSSKHGVGSRFHVLRARTRFWRYRGRWVPFSSFARPDLFSTVTRASGPVFLFCAPELIFGGTEGVGTHFLVLRARTCFPRYRGLRVLFSCFACPDSFSPVPRALVPIFMFCALEIVFSGTEGVVSRFHVLRARTRFRQYRGRRHTVRPFFARSAPPLGDGMRKKDTEIPPKRAFV
jgi:hypothetical protein